jgi:hypothetical protein
VRRDLAGQGELKVAPGPELSTAHKRQPCDSIIDRLVGSPIPVPLFLTDANHGCDLASVWFVSTGSTGLALQNENVRLSVLPSLRRAGIRSTAQGFVLRSYRRQVGFEVP